MDHYVKVICFKLNCSKLKEDKGCSKCCEDNKETTDCDTSDREYILQDEFISNEILSNISTEKGEFIDVIKENMLDENIKYTTSSNYINP